MSSSSYKTERTPAGRRRASLYLLSVLALAGLAFLCGLGLWQLQRLEWKLGIIARIQARINTPAVPLPREAEWKNLANRDSEYLKVRIAGTFDHSKEAFIFRAAGAGHIGPGFHVLTPVRIDGGAYVLINRGFVPEKLRQPSKRAAGQINGRVAITGLLRKPETRNRFTPKDQPERSLWYTRDPQAIAHHYKLQRAAPFVIDADKSPNPGGWPQGGATRVNIRNDHLSYALTWFGLAGTLLAIYALLVWQILRRRVGS